MAYDNIQKILEEYSASIKAQLDELPVEENNEEAVPDSINMSFAPEDASTVRSIAGRLELSGYRVTLIGTDAPEYVHGIFMAFLSEAYISTPECMAALKKAGRNPDYTSVVYIGSSELPENLIHKLNKLNFINASFAGDYFGLLVDEISGLPKIYSCRVKVTEDIIPSSAPLSWNKTFTTLRDQQKSIINCALRSGELVPLALGLCRRRIDLLRKSKQKRILSETLLTAGKLCCKLPAYDSDVYGSEEAVNTLLSWAESYLTEAESTMEDIAISLKAFKRLNNDYSRRKADLWITPVVEAFTELAKVALLRHDLEAAYDAAAQADINSDYISDAISQRAMEAVANARVIVAECSIRRREYKLALDQLDAAEKVCINFSDKYTDSEAAAALRTRVRQLRDAVNAVRSLG